MRQAELRPFLHAVSHDLQEPLRAVTAFAELLSVRHRDALDAEGREFLDRVLDGARGLRERIDALLELSRLAASDLKPERVDAAASLASALSGLQPSIEEARAGVTHGPLPVLRADRDLLRRLFFGLVDNALKFRGARPPEIRVEAERRGEPWEFTVRDNGIGIDPRHAERIFGVFERLHTREEYGGAGIGLALCRAIVERHGGRIWVESAPGGGSVFHFTLACGGSA